MRGKVSVLETNICISRITPAYAGKSIYPIIWNRKMRDHPRLCGEKPFWFVSAITLQGSPPPMRGKDMENAGMTDAMRITPAYAGKSLQIIKSTIVI